MPAGEPVQFWHNTELANPTAVYVDLLPPMGRGPHLRLSHGWLNGTLQAAFTPAAAAPAIQHAVGRIVAPPPRQDQWPLVLPEPQIRFSKGRREAKPIRLGPKRFPAHFVRTPLAAPPELSLILVRWGGEHAVGAGCDGDGGWGRWGCPPSDEYMQALVELGVLSHPPLQSQGGGPGNVEVLSLFVSNSQEVLSLIQIAPWLAHNLRGKRKACFWMLWPAEWEDTGDSDYAGYVDRRALFLAMRACEEAGLKTGFPHPADLYEVITSKSWMASLCMLPQARLPAATLVSKGSVSCDSRKAAKEALAALDHIKRICPFQTAPGEPPAPSRVNAAGVKKGVVKLGWSWEGRYVCVFQSEEQLASRLEELLGDKGCLATTAIVQEWVDFDFEMRLYILPPGDWVPGQRLEPTKIECNSWNGFGDEGRPQFFKKMTEAMCLSAWEQDEAALRSAKEKAIDIAQFLLAWMLTMHSEMVPMIRLDFMLKRLGPGQARVVFGEYCEMGACCLAWEEGPPTIWRAAVDAVLR